MPTEYGHRQVLVKAFVWEVVISCTSEVIARHPRGYGWEDMVFNPLHYPALLEQKTNALDQAPPLEGWRCCQLEQLRDIVIRSVATLSVMAQAVVTERRLQRIAIATTGDCSISLSASPLGIDPGRHRGARETVAPAERI